MTKPTRLTRRKALSLAGLCGLAASPILASAAMAQTPKQKKQFPRISRAIEEMQATKEFLEKSPNKFGGRKAKAITALEVAIVDLKLAMQYASA